MLTVDQALALVTDRVAVAACGATESVELLDAVGRVLAEDVRTDIPLPPFSRSTMDGFAVRSAEAAAPGAAFRVVGESAAGRPFAGEPGAGEAVRIFTGAPVPAALDAVCMVERTAEAGGVVTLGEAMRAGRNISRQGEDLAAGEVALARGTRVDAAHVGLLASVGAARLSVRCRPRVAILTTGSELVAPQERPAFGFIRESNGSALAALVAQAGGAPLLLERVDDDRERIQALAERGLECDMLLLTGGSSVGDYDFTPAVLRALGVAVHFDRVAMKPGKPTLFGTRQQRVVFGLPGNPISAFVAFHLFVRPALLRQQGIVAVMPQFFGVTLASPLPANPVREQVLPGTLAVERNELVAHFLGWSGSGDVTCLRRTNALLRLPAGPLAAAVGERVMAMALAGGAAADGGA